MAHRGTPRDEGTGHLAMSATGNYSDAGRQERESCKYCDSGGRIKTLHTYTEGCKKYVRGATKMEMEHAARGGEGGRKKLMEKLGIREDERDQVQRGQEQRNKEKEKTKDRQTPARKSSPPTREKTPPVKVGNKKNTKEEIPQSPGEDDSSPDMVEVILGKQKKGNRSQTSQGKSK